MTQGNACRGVGLAVAAGLLFVGSAQAAQAVNRPYLQSVTPNSAVVVFRADQACPAQVRFAAGEQAEQVAASSESQAQHEVRLEGLQPGTEYRYTVEACGSVLEPEKRFRTAPAPGTTDVQFGVIGDFGKGTAAQTSVADQILAQRPEVLVTVGDNIYSDGTDEEFTANFLAPMGSLFAEIPLYPAFGNHDYAADDLETSLANFVVPTNNPRGTERYYSFDWGNVHFSILDSICLVGETSHPECDIEEQFTWLSNDLKASKAHWKVVLMHNPLFSGGKYGDPETHPENVELRARLIPIFEENGVNLVLSGDDHLYERTRPMKGTEVAPEGERGIIYAVVGNGSEERDFTQDVAPWSAQRDNTNIGYLDVRTRGDTLEGRMIGADGQTYDNFTITKPLPPGTQTPGTQPPEEPLNPEEPSNPSTPPSSPGTPPTAGTESPAEPTTGETNGKSGCAAAGGPIALGVAGLVLWRRRRRASR